MNTQKGTKGFVTVDPEERFWARVDKAGPSGCWLWMGAKARGYGQFYLNGRNRKATHVAWLLTHGSIPEGKMACHTCDNPTCVNPAHIFWGTMSDNILDAVKKGRHDPRGNALRTHCKRGHPLAGDNLGIRPSTGHRECRTCKAMHNQARYSIQARAALAGNKS
jgi:hypothetical protein